MNIAVQALRYGTVGVINTVVGLSVIYGCMALGLGDVASNLIGYAVGLLVSFRLNSGWTFARSGAGLGAAGRFALVIGVAYLANLAAMLAARDGLGLNSHLAQFVGVIVYAVIGFVGSRSYAFRQ